jgi:hypothetical protein
VTKTGRPEIAADPRCWLATMSQKFDLLAGTLSHELLKELRRLNSGRIGSAQLSRLAPRDRVRAVKAALAAHHKATSRCC